MHVCVCTSTVHKLNDAWGHVDSIAPFQLLSAAEFWKHRKLTRYGKQLNFLMHYFLRGPSSTPSSCYVLVPLSGQLRNI